MIILLRKPMFTFPTSAFVPSLCSIALFTCVPIHSCTKGIWTIITIAAYAMMMLHIVAFMMRLRIFIFSVSVTLLTCSCCVWIMPCGLNLYLCKGKQFCWNKTA